MEIQMRFYDLGQEDAFEPFIYSYNVTSISPNFTNFIII